MTMRLMCVALLLTLGVTLMNVHGRAVWQLKRPHGRSWYMNSIGSRVEPDGRYVTYRKHPDEEYEKRMMIVEYRHGWPYEIFVRDPYTELVPSLMWLPDGATPSSPWPIDSAHIYWGSPGAMTLNASIGLAIVVVGTCMAYLLTRRDSQPRRS